MGLLSQTRTADEDAMRARREWEGWGRTMLGVLLLGLLGLPAPLLASEQVIFGPTQYTRTSGPPNQFRETIALPPTLTAPFRLHVQNGGADGSHRTSSATITLNGAQVASPSDFSQGVAGFDRTVTLQANNTLQVRLTSSPGSFLVLTLYGTIPPPTLTLLEPPAMPITQGGTGSLTATISGAQPTETGIALQSSDPSIASVPPTVMVPAGQVSVAVPVAAVAPGTATITATLNGSAIQSTVTVHPAGPTLTSLLPPTLQVTQGASGTLTLTLSAAQATDTGVALSSSDPSIAGLPPSGSVTVPAGQLSQTFAIFGASGGQATITATLNGTTVQSQVTVVVPLPTVVSLLPPVLPLTEGSQGTLTVSLSASQPTPTEVFLSASDAAIVGLPGDRVVVPANTLSAAFPVSGLRRGLATVTAALNGSSVTAAITVLPPPPMVQSLACPASLTVGATGLCTVTLNATQLTDTLVPLASTDPGLVTVPATVTVPANTLTASFVATGIAVGSATLIAGPLNGTTQSTAVQVLPPPPTVQSLLPPTGTLFVGATATVTLTLNAAQLADTVVPLTSSPTGVISAPATVTVPAGVLSAPVTVTGLAPGLATLTAGPLNGTSAQSSLAVNQLPPTVTALTPATLSLPKGKAGTLTLTIAPTQPEATVVPLTSSDTTSVEVPGSVTIPAGGSTADIPLLARAVGSATLTAGPLNGTSQQATITVTPAELVTLAITPPAPTIAKGETQQFSATGTYTDGTTLDLTGAAAWTSSDETVATITGLGGLATGVSVGQATVTATVASVAATATLTVTPPILASIAITPQNPTRNVGETLQFQAVGTLTDGTTQDVTTGVAWTSSLDTVATISATGLASALAAGVATITATHSEGFTAATTLTVVLPPPTLARFEPSAGPVGTVVTLTGMHLGTTVGVTFNGTAAAFTVIGATQVTATVPSGATSGPLTLTTAGGSVTTPGHFLVLPTQDVALTVEPATVTAILGTSVAVAVRTVATGGYTGLTQLSVVSLPDGVSAAFAPASLGPNASGVLTLTTSGSTPTGSLSIQVRGSATIGGTPVTRTASTILTVQAPGQTSLAGQVRDADAKPLAGVSITLGGSTLTPLGTTDAGGNFLVSVPVAGSQVFLIDGSTANTASVSYPTIPVTVLIQPGAVNGLGFVPHLHAQPPTQPLPVAPATATPITFASVPDFQLTIPAGVTIVGWDGQVNTQIGVRLVPLDRLAVPPPPSSGPVPAVFMFSFGKVGGGTPTQPIPVTAPNLVGAYPGQQVDLWYYNEAPDGSAPNAWQTFGTGTVSSDGRLIVSDPGVGIPRFCCGAFYFPPPPPPANTPPAETAPQPSPEDCPVCGGPIDLASGLVRVDATDLRMAGRVPLMLTRTYRTLDPTVGPFGVGWRHSSEVFVRALSPDLALLITPANLRPRFAKQADGSFLNTDLPRFRGARLTRAGDGTWSLRFKDSTLWTFNAAGWLTAQRDRNGNTLTITRDSQNRVTAHTDPAGRSLAFSYGGSGLTVQQVTDPLGRTVQYAYDGSNRLIRVTDPAGGTWQYSYDAAGRLETITDPRGTVTERNTYDSAGRVIQQVQADGGTFQLAYQVTAGTITGVTVTDPNGHALTYRFTGGRFLTEATDALGQKTQTTRAAGSNLVTRRTDALGRQTQYTYDSNGNVLTITDALNNTRTFTYEPTFNQVLTATDPLGQVTSYSYDASGNLTSLSDPLGHTTSFGYNAFGQLVSATDALGNTTSFEYDSVGNLVATMDPLGNRTERTYDANSRLVMVKDPKGGVTRFGYDSLDRLVTASDPLGGTTTFSYDPNGNLLTVTDAKGQTTTHTYDPVNRLATRTDALNRTESYTYDPNGNLRTVADRKGQVTTHTYDAQNRRARTEYADGSSVAFAYDPSGNLLTAADSQTGSVTRSYDALDRLVEEVTPQGAITYAYDSAGRRSQMQVNGLEPVAYVYDVASRLTAATRGPQAATLAYDPTNRRTSLTLPNGITVTYTHDEASRLIGQTFTGPGGVLGDLAYTYDVVGNRIATDGSWARSLIPSSVPSSNYDAANEQLAFGAFAQTFDANGNLLTQTDASGTTTYTWDARNRLSAISGPIVAAIFAYDAFGRRSSKTINGRSITFQYDGLDIIRESGTNGDAAYLRTLAIDEALTRTDGTGSVSYLADALGSTIALADSSAILSTHYTYEPFGETSVSGPVSSHLFQFTGRENDGTGLYYYRARYYVPTLGRFLSADPIGIASGQTNLYVYVFSNPVNFADPTGELAEAIALGGAAVGTGAAIAVGGAAAGVAAVAICYATPACWKYVDCYAQYVRDLAQCAKKAIEKVCAEPDTEDTGFSQCKNRADRRLRICLRGGHLTPVGGRGFGW